MSFLLHSTPYQCLPFSSIFAAVAVDGGGIIAESALLGPAVRCIFVSLKICAKKVMTVYFCSVLRSLVDFVVCGEKKASS